MPRVKVISIFFALAMFIQLGYYFDFIEFIESDENPLHNFKTHSFSSSPSLLPPLHALCSKTKWKPNVYINCSNISTNAFSAINQYQVCYFKIIALFLFYYLLNYIMIYYYLFSFFFNIIK